MAITENNTLPKQWDSSISYDNGVYVSYLGVIYRSSQPSINKNPVFNPDYWTPIDIYLKDMTVMEHGDYSGDANFWERDQIYIDVNGWVYVNNENTGINVKGKDGDITVSFDDLTPEQKEQIRGFQGQIGPQGPQGIPGPQGPVGEVTLTDEQVEVLKGDEGKSTYQIWLDQGHTGTEADFLAWLRAGVITLDNKLDTESTNGIENRAIAQAFNIYRNKIDTLIRQFENHITDLENRLKYVYSGNEYQFKYGITSEGKQGYFEQGTSRIIPFNNTDETNIVTNLATNTLATSSKASPLLTSFGIETAPLDDGTVYFLKDGKFIDDENFNLQTYSTVEYDRENGTLIVGSPTWIPEPEGGCVGFWINADQFDSLGGILTIKLYSDSYKDIQYGTFINNNAKLPDLYSTGEYRIQSINQRIYNGDNTISINLNPNEKFYFCIYYNYSQATITVNEISLSPKESE